jgi:hypothetical protein
MKRQDDPEMRELKELAGKRRPGGPKRMGEVVGRLIARKGYVDDLGEEQRLAAWRAAAGTLAAHSRPGRLNRGTLEVLVKNSVVLQEITFQKAVILGRLRERPEWRTLTEIRFRVGTID